MILTQILKGKKLLLSGKDLIRLIICCQVKQAVAVANAEGIPLSEEDVRSWVAIIDSFLPEGEPSMRQDGKAHRKSEVELFSGTIRRLAARHGIAVPVNDWLYEKVQEMESAY